MTYLAGPGEAGHGLPRLIRARLGETGMAGMSKKEWVPPKIHTVKNPGAKTPSPPPEKPEDNQKGGK